MRAVGVYEWTGDMAKPAASRLIPVSLFIDGKLEDAAVYQARPVPFALLTGNVYELDKAGVTLGTLDLAFARKLVAPATASTTYDDGWFGYGRFVPPAPPKKSSALKPVTTLSKINGLDDEGDDKPHFSSRSATPGSGGSATPTPGTGDHHGQQHSGGRPGSAYAAPCSEQWVRQRRHRQYEQRARRSRPAHSAPPSQRLRTRAKRRTTSPPWAR